MFNHNNTSAARGFTLIEMLVVAPLLILLIGTMIAYLSSLTGTGLKANAQLAMAYDTQEALNDMGAYSSLATALLASTSTLPNGQGSDNSTAAFTATTSSKPDTLIIQIPATDKSSLDPARSLIYTGASPCDTSASTLKYLLVYFVGTDNSLYKRTIVPYPTGTSGCATPYQRNSCSPSNMTPSVCQARDEKLLDNVSTLSVVYYKDDGVTATTPDQASNAEVTIAASQAVSDSTISYSGSLRIRAINYKTNTSP